MHPLSGDVDTHTCEGDKELDEDAPEVDAAPASPPPCRLQMARINPATLDILSGALELFTPRQCSAGTKVDGPADAHQLRGAPPVLHRPDRSSSGRAPV